MRPGGAAPAPAQHPARGLSTDEVQRLLAVIPHTPAGTRDRAIILFLLLTGRRRSEVLPLTAGDIELGEPAFWAYRGKGGTRGRRELPAPAYAALMVALTVFGRRLEAMAPTDPIWPTAARAGGVSGATMA